MCHKFLFSLNCYHLTYWHWRRKWQPIPVFLPGEFHEQRSLAGYSSWGHKESDTTERLITHHSLTHSRIGMHPVVKFFLWSLVPHMGPWPFCFSPPNTANTRQCRVCLWLLFSDYRRHFGRMQRRQNWILNMRLYSLKAPWKISNQDHLTGFPVPSAPPHCWLDLAFFFFPTIIFLLHLLQVTGSPAQSSCPPLTSNHSHT